MDGGANNGSGLSQDRPLPHDPHMLTTIRDEARRYARGGYNVTTTIEIVTASRPSGAQRRRSCLLASVTAQSSSAPPPPPRPPSPRRRRGLQHFSNRIFGLLLRRNACAIWVGGLDRALGARSRGGKTTGRGFGTRAHAPVLAWSRAFVGGSWSRWALLGFVGSYPGFIEFDRVLSIVGFYQALSGFSGLWLRLWWALVGFGEGAPKTPRFLLGFVFLQANSRPIPQNGLPNTKKGTAPLHFFFIPRRGPNFFIPARGPNFFCVDHARRFPIPQAEYTKNSTFYSKNGTILKRALCCTKNNTTPTMVRVCSKTRRPVRRPDLRCALSRPVSQSGPRTGHCHPIFGQCALAPPICVAAPMPMMPSRPGVPIEHA